MNVEAQNDARKDDKAKIFGVPDSLALILQPIQILSSLPCNCYFSVWEEILIQQPF